MIVALLAATVLLADATPAASQTPAAAAPAKKAEDSQKMVCKSEQVLGSRLPVKKCRTAEQAAADKQSAQEELQRAQGAMANNPH